MEKHISRVLKALTGSDEWRYLGDGYTEHPIYPYCFITGEVTVGETVLPFKLPVRAELFNRGQTDD